MRPQKLKRLALVSIALLLVILSGVTASARPRTDKKAASGYHLLKRIEVGGEGGWDYLTVDSDARRLYVSHATRAVVIDLNKGTVVGEIANTNGIHGIAIASDVGRGFTSNGRDNNVTIFDLKTLNVLGQVKTGTNPDAIIYDPASRRVFAFNGRSNDATAIDAATGTVAGTLALGGKPEFAVADGRGMVYVNIEDKSEVAAIDSKNLTVKAHWSLAPGEEPSGLAIDRQTRRLFAVCANKKMVVMNADNGKVVADLAIGQGVDGVAFDTDMKLAFSSNGEGTLTVVHEDAADKYTVVETVPTQRGARTIALDPKTHVVYVTTAQFGPPPPATPERPRPRPTIVPGSFVVLVFGK